MNIQHIMQESLCKDYQRLIQLCSSYGLNQQQTNQIISDFKNGSFAQADQSIDQSFQQSLKQHDYHNQHEQSQANEEYEQQNQRQTRIKSQKVSTNSHFNHSISHSQQSNSDNYSRSRSRNQESSRLGSQMCEVFQERDEESSKDQYRNRQQSEDRSLGQEYSFKNRINKNLDSKRQSNNGKNYRRRQYGGDFFQSGNKAEESQTIAQDIIFYLEKHRKQLQSNMNIKYEKQNQALKLELKEKDQRIGALIKLKTQDSEVILSLKDTISKMAQIIKQKQQSYSNLQQKYEKLKLQNESLSTQKTSKVQLSHLESINSFQERKSIVRQRQKQYERKQNCYTQSDIPKAINKKSSQKYIKDVSNNRSHSSRLIDKTIQYENVSIKQSFIKKDETKRSGVDINKYKGMIEKLRGSYQLR